MREKLLLSASLKWKRKIVRMQISVSKLLEVCTNVPNHDVHFYYTDTNEISLSEIATKTVVSYNCVTDDIKEKLNTTTVKAECIKRKDVKVFLTDVEACFCETDFCNCNGDQCNGAKALYDLNITEWFWACVLVLALSKNIFGF